MGFLLPDYAYTPLRAYNVCAIVLDDDVSAPDDEIVLGTCHEKHTDDPLWIRLVINEQHDPDGIHVHVDIVRNSEFDNDSVPEESATLEELFEALSQYRGCEMGVIPSAKFVVPRDQLPSDGVVSLLSTVVISGRNEGIKLTGGTFSVDSGAIDQIRWRISEKNNDEILSCTIVGNQERTLDNHYLVEPIKSLKTVFETFVLESSEE